MRREEGFAGLASSAMRRAFGRTWLSISSRFAAQLGVHDREPRDVRPGWAREATKRAYRVGAHRDDGTCPGGVHGGRVEAAFPAKITSTGIRTSSRANCES